MTSIISEHLYRFLEEEKILPEERKGCKRNIRRTKGQVLVDKTMLKDFQRRSTSLVMAWMYYRKAYDMIPHSWSSECLEVFGVAGNTHQKTPFIANSMSKWKLELTSNGVSLGNAEIRRGIFEGDSLSPFLFVIRMVPLSLILRKAKFHYVFSDKKARINHFLFMDNLKLFAKLNDQIDSLVNRVYRFSEDIGMEFGTQKRRLFVLKRGKVKKVNSRGLNLPNGKFMKTIDEKGYK